MGWYSQAKIFFKEVSESKAKKSDEPTVTKEDMEFVSSASEARLLDVPQGASFLIMLTALLIIALIAWAVVMPVDEVVKAQGKVVPSKQIQVIQNLEGGIIKKIDVVEGQSVKKGQELLVIDDVYAKSDLTDNVNSYNNLLARLVAINTGLAGKRILNFPKELQSHIEIMQTARSQFNAEWDETMSNVKQIEFEIEQRKKELDAATSVLGTAEEDLEISKEELQMNKQAYKEQVIAKIKLLQSKHQYNENNRKYKQAKHELPKAKAAFDEASQKRDSYIAQRRNELEKEHSEVKTKLDSMQSKGVSLEAKLSHSIVTSPVDGTIKKINFNTIGGVIRPGMDILEIVPTDDELIIEAKVKPKDIGFIHRGLHAKVKLTAYDFSTYGGLEGKVEFVSADTITDKKGASFFLVRIRTSENFILDKKGKEHIIIPGMKAESNIVVDQKSIIEYILKPMLK